jgi:hypothetical protein
MVITIFASITVYNQSNNLKNFHKITSTLDGCFALLEGLTWKSLSTMKRLNIMSRLTR